MANRAKAPSCFYIMGDGTTHFYCGEPKDKAIHRPGSVRFGHVFVLREKGVPSRTVFRSDLECGCKVADDCPRHGRPSDAEAERLRFERVVKRLVKYTETGTTGDPMGREWTALCEDAKAALKEVGL